MSSLRSLRGFCQQGRPLPERPEAAVREPITYSAILKQSSVRLLAICFFSFGAASHVLFGDDGDALPLQSRETLVIQNGEPIVVPVEAFGEKYQFVLDTGCNLSIFDISFRERLGEAVKRQDSLTPTGVRSFEFFAAPELKIGHRSPEAFRSRDNVACADLSQAREAGRGDEMGIIGMDFLKSHVVRINFDKGIAQIKRTAIDNQGSPVRIQMNSERPWMRLAVSNDGNHNFLIDTGNVGEIYLNSKLFNRLSLRGRIVLKAVSRGAEIGKEIVIRTGVLDSLEFGDYRINNVRVCEGTENSVGLNFLSRFDVEFDFPNRTAYFKPGQQVNSPDRWNRAGFGVRRIKGKTIAAITDPAGTAAQKGICDDDEILSVNGIPASKMSLAQIRRLCSEPDADQLTIAFQRDGTETGAVLDLSKEREPFPTTPNLKTVKSIVDK